MPFKVEYTCNGIDAVILSGMIRICNKVNGLLRHQVLCAKYCGVYPYGKFWATVNIFILHGCRDNMDLPDETILLWECVIFKCLPRSVLLMYVIYLLCVVVVDLGPQCVRVVQIMRWWYSNIGH